MTGRIEKTVFISYRRMNLQWALAIFQNLKSEGYDVFLDYLSIPSGDFEKIIVQNIKARAHFIVVLTPSALERCNEPGDWLRREIETAMDEKRNIVPLMLESFDFGGPSALKALTGKLEKLNKYNGLRVHSDYFFEGMTRLREQFLNVSLDAIVHPISESAKSITEEHQTAASEAPRVETEELTAQEWLEKGYTFQAVRNFGEAIRCYSEAIQLKSNNSDFYFFRGSVFAEINELENAMEDLNRAIKIDPDHKHGHELLGLLYSNKRDNTKALSHLQKALEVDPNDVVSRSSMIRILKLLGRDDEAKEQAQIVRRSIQKEDEYAQACFEAICGNIDRALELLKIGLGKNPSKTEWAKKDPDFENIRDDPRFKILVGG